MISPKEISSKRFEKSALGGYKIEDVDQFLRDLAVDISQMMKEKEDCDKKIDILADKVREYMKDEDALKDALLGAQRQSHQIIEEAQITASKIIAEANEKANRIIGQTKFQLENDKIALSNMQKEVSDFKARLLSLYKSHLDLITAMPEVDGMDDSEHISYQPENIREEETEPAEQHSSVEQKKQNYPFPTQSGNNNDSHYTDLKFGHNSK